MSGGEDAGHGDTHSGAVPETADQPAGLASSRGGYTLTPTVSTLTAGTSNDLSFRITGPDGTAVTAFDEEHTKQLHLIVVRRDTTGYQHLHPTMDPDGTWHARLDTPAGGVYRAFADFTPTGGPATTLGVDLSVAGAYAPVVHETSRLAEIDGYQVRLDGELTAGQASPLTLTVTKDGAAVTDLQPYLGAYGHLVALRATDLAYLHVHPDGSPDDGRTPAGPQIRFVAEVPSSADYRLFLDFQHAGTVHTAEFTVPTGPPTLAPDTASGAAATHTATHARTAQEGGH
ncbi:putative secreted protein [Pseudonocardia sp. N23]|nr:putative secreted protein [Pseudonocardia sp. N23]